MPARLDRRRFLLAGATMLVLPADVAAQATPLPAAGGEPTGAEWPAYGQGLAGARVGDGSITTANVGQLAPAWSDPVAGPVSATPVIANGVAYAGCYAGRLHAIGLHDGKLRWIYETGAQVPEPNLGIPLGIVGSAVVGGDTVYVGDATATLHAIDVATGQARWTVKVDAQPQACLWSSPVLHDGTLYVGVASVAKEAGFRGSVVALDAASGEPRWQTFMVPAGADGAGVFAVPALDIARNRLYVGTQNAYTAHPAPYGNPISIVALDLTTGALAWAFDAPPNDGATASPQAGVIASPQAGVTAPTDDVGFSASPNLFTATIDGTPRDLVGEGQKSGDYWALDRDSGEVVWQAKVAPAGFLGGMEGTSAAGTGIIAVPATDWPEFDGPAGGLVTALDAATGAPLWTVTQAAPAASPATISGDLVFHAGMDGILHAYALASGEEAWSAALEASVSGGIAVSAGVVVLGAATPEFAPFVQPGNTIRAFALPTQATPGAGTPVAP